MDSKTIADVIRNPMNKGDYRYNYRESARGRKKPQEEVIYIKGVFEPLVSINDWEKANKLMDGRGFKMNSSGQIIMNKRCNVFTGLIFCGSAENDTMLEARTVDKEVDSDHHPMRVERNHEKELATTKISVM